MFVRRSPYLTEIYNATETVSVSPLNVTPKFEDIDVTCNSPEVQAKGLLLSCCIDRHLKSLKVSWKVNGTINITGKINKKVVFHRLGLYIVQRSPPTWLPQSPRMDTGYAPKV